MNLIFLTFIKVLFTLALKQSLCEPIRGSFTLHATQCSLHLEVLTTFGC